MAARSHGRLGTEDGTGASRNLNTLRSSCRKSGIPRKGGLLSWVAISYNCQCLTQPTRLQFIQQQLKPDILALQGTREAPRQHPNTGAVETNWNDTNGAFRTWHWTRPPEMAATYPCGVAISLRQQRCLRGVRSECQTPTDPMIQGRAGILRLKRRGICDFICAVA